MQGTVLMALLQPAPEVYELFDDILLMAEGHVIYHGPKEEVLPFFESLGFKLPPRKGIGDFLQEVSNTLVACVYCPAYSIPLHFPGHVNSSQRSIICQAAASQEHQGFAARGALTLRLASDIDLLPNSSEHAAI